VFPSGECAPCLPGYYSNTNSTDACVRCSPGSYSLTSGSEQCENNKANMFTVSAAANRVLAYNADEQKYKLVSEETNHPAGIAFVDDSSFLVSNNFGGDVTHMDVDGNYLGTFLVGAYGLLRLPELNWVAIASGGGKVKFLNWLTGAPSMMYATAKIPADLGAVRYLSRGERDNEILVTNAAGEQVWRLCIPGQACDPKREKVMVEGGTELMGLAVLRDRGQFLVADKEEGVVYACPLGEVAPEEGEYSYSYSYEDPGSSTTSGPANTTRVSDCDVFAKRPDATDMYPSAVLHDPDLQLVYVGDTTYAKIHTFTEDGVYVGRVEDSKGDLSSITALALKPGIYAPGSPVLAPSSATAGEKIEVPIKLETHLGVAITTNYALEKEAPRFKVKAVGLIPGTDFTATVDGVVEYNVVADPHEALTAVLDIDPPSDVVNAVFKVVDREFTLFVTILFVVVGFASIYAAWGAISTRSRVVNKFTKIKDGDKELMRKCEWHPLFSSPNPTF
ncbi:hypothetical protein TeGR_g14583, partial [Tetraparma gracilis]